MSFALLALDRSLTIEYEKLRETLEKASLPASPLVLLLGRSVIHFLEIHARWNTAAGIVLPQAGLYRPPLPFRGYDFPLKNAPEFFLSETIAKYYTNEFYFLTQDS